MLLQTKKLSLKRGTTPELFFPDVTITKGDSVLLLGSSGSGKSTLLSMLSGLLPSTSGEIMCDGKNLYDMPMTERDSWRATHIGFVFQSFHLLPSLTVSQNILLATSMGNTKLPKNRLPDLLETLGLTDKANAKPHDLSQGQQQRAAIARAVINNPALLIADEPTSALDDENAAQVLTLLESQARETGAALLIASHDSRITQNFTNILRLDNQNQKVAA